MTKAEAATIFRNMDHKLSCAGLDGTHYALAADALESIERLETERDKFQAQVVSKDEWICQWLTYAHSAQGRMDTRIRERFIEDIKMRFMRGEFDAIEWLRDRDDRMKSIGAEEQLKKLAERINEMLDEKNLKRFEERWLTAVGYCEGLQECIDYIDEAVDEIKARREATDEA